MDYLKNFKISVRHTPFRYASHHIPNENRAHLSNGKCVLILYIKVDLERII